MTKLSFWSLALLTGVGCTVVACGSDDDTATGSAGSGGKGTAGAKSVGSAGEGGASGAGEGGAAGEGSTLYSRLGGHDGIAKAIGAIVGKELMDTDIASFFAPNLDDPNYKPQPGDIEECLTAQLGTAAEGPGEEYPITTTSGFKCRTMADAHKDLHIGSGTFDNFVTIAGAELKELKVSDNDITAIAGVLTGTKTDIVDPDAPATGPCTSAACEVPEGGAGGAGGSN